MTAFGTGPTESLMSVSAAVLVSLKYTPPWPVCTGSATSASGSMSGTSKATAFFGASSGRSSLGVGSASAAGTVAARVGETLSM